MSDERPSLLPPLKEIYARLSVVERERKELRQILRIALDRQQRETNDPGNGERLKTIPPNGLKTDPSIDLKADAKLDKITAKV